MTSPDDTSPFFIWYWEDVPEATPLSSNPRKGDFNKAYLYFKQFKHDFPQVFEKTMLNPHHIFRRAMEITAMPEEAYNTFNRHSHEPDDVYQTLIHVLNKEKSFFDRYNILPGDTGRTTAVPSSPATTTSAQSSNISERRHSADSVNERLQQAVQDRIAELG